MTELNKIFESHWLNGSSCPGFKLKLNGLTKEAENGY